jgi:hypothetical protein
LVEVDAPVSDRKVAREIGGMGIVIIKSVVGIIGPGGAVAKGPEFLIVENQVQANVLDLGVLIIAYAAQKIVGVGISIVDARAKEDGSDLKRS